MGSTGRSGLIRRSTDEHDVARHRKRAILSVVTRGIPDSTISDEYCADVVDLNERGSEVSTPTTTRIMIYIDGAIWLLNFLVSELFVGIHGVTCTREIDEFRAARCRLLVP